MQKVTFDYFTIDNYDQYSFLRIPKRLMTDDYYSGISIQAKLLYGLLLDRMEQTEKNDWYDEENRAYVIYPLDEMAGDLGVSKRKISDCMNELEDVDLAERVQRGRGIPNIIYVKKFIPDEGACLPGSHVAPFRVAR
ncbi:MAG: replication initiator protein A [Candidatus Weimeria sp.]